jgi:hypothetical protein
MPGCTDAHNHFSDVPLNWHATILLKAKAGISTLVHCTLGKQILEVYQILYSSRKSSTPQPTAGLLGFAIGQFSSPL